MRIMGIDPGTRRVGYGIIDKDDATLTLVVQGTVDPFHTEALPARLKTIFEELSALIRHHAPDVVAIEDVFAGKGAKSSIKIGEGRGVALVCVALADLPIAEYTATKVKMATTGNGHAGKGQVQKMVRAILSLSDEVIAEDAADALAVAICHCHRI